MAKPKARKKKVMIELTDDLIRVFKIRALKAGAGVKYQSIIETVLYNEVNYESSKRT